MNKALILVVEDDRPIRNLIVTTLKTHDYKYITAENGSTTRPRRTARVSLRRIAPLRREYLRTQTRISRCRRPQRRARNNPTAFRIYILPHRFSSIRSACGAPRCRRYPTVEQALLQTPKHIRSEGECGRGHPLRSLCERFRKEK